jgi:hypothetical protein
MLLSSCALRNIERLRESIIRDTGSNATVNVRTHNGVTTVDVVLLDPLRAPPAATKARVEALVRTELASVASIVVFARL